MSDKEYLNLMDRSERNILKGTLKMAEGRCQSGVDLDNIFDAKPMTPSGVSGEKELLAESKKAKEDK
jgi:hypothetical protein